MGSGGHGNRVAAAAFCQIAFLHRNNVHLVSANRCLHLPGEIDLAFCIEERVFGWLPGHAGVASSYLPGIGVRQRREVARPGYGIASAIGEDYGPGPDRSGARAARRRMGWRRGLRLGNRILSGWRCWRRCCWRGRGGCRRCGFVGLSLNRIDHRMFAVEKEKSHRTGGKNSCEPGQSCLRPVRR